MRQAASMGGTGGTTYLNNARMTLGQLDMDAEHWAAARDELREASRGFAAAEIQTGEADAEALLALCTQAMKNTAEREVAVERARKLRQAITSRQEVYIVDIALAQISAASLTNKTAIEKLLTLAADAEQRRFNSLALEAKLAAYRLLRAQGQSKADPLRSEIEKTAREHGFGRILKLLGPPHPATG